MKFKQLCWVGVGLLAGIATLSAKPILVNGGKDLDHLAKLENKLNEGDAEIDLSVVMRHGRWPIGYLEMAQAGKFTNPALCAAWHSSRHQPATGEYTVSAEITLVGNDEVYDGVGGVIGWLDSKSGVGISFALNHYDGFQVGTVSFLAENTEANRSLDGLFDLDGLPARATIDSAWSGKGSHDRSKWVRMELTFSAPTEEDRAALEDVTARITAVVFKTGKKIVEGTREIVLLTNLPMPEGSKHRFGYFGYWDSLWDEGSKIALCRNLKIDGELYNSPPTIEPIGDHVINENETAEMRVVVDDVEVYSSRLVVTGESSNLALVPPEGIAVGLSGSKRTVVITPVANAFGEAVITITVSDGEKQATTVFTLTVNEVNEPPVLSIVRSGEGKLVVDWTGGGELQASDNLKKWQPVEDAASPLAVDPAAARKYYRVILE
ncbi:MAG: hypothetical protein QGG00_09745 [Verrucomicrobiota bacterium]|jgi:hypothetical protein|nr:hypothetical protein [Verrucomicrobiota bacterium]